MADAESYPVTDEHCLAFSAIVPHFARHERLMEIAIASLLRSTVGPTSIAVAGLGFTGKRDALKSLIKLSTLPDETATNIYSFLDKLQTRAALRNAIAHNVWRGGKRKGSIKPLGALPRGAGLGKFGASAKTSRLIQLPNSSRSRASWRSSIILFLPTFNPSGW